jgi:hypothetical protein
VPEHVYLQERDQPADTDRPLFTAPTGRLAEHIVTAVNGLAVMSPFMQIEFDRIGAEILGD